MPIARLSTLLINQIAAGEVIERPASVVKELVDNSLDSGARRVQIAIEKGGADLIRISDDGNGICEKELPLAVTAHATSKLSNPQQLAAIGTLGFRGEALASIASVSHLKIASKPTVDGQPAQSGASIEASGDQIGAVVPGAGAPGTVVTVRNLFFNTPARRKFLRQASTEISHINQAVGQIAMAHPEIGFELTHNGRKTLDLPATDSPQKRCLAILGKDLEEGMLEFKDEDQSHQVKLWGLAGQPSISRSNSKYIYICLNGRPIRDRNLIHAVREAYRGLVAPGKYPVVVVLIEMPAQEVDVNVHPAKSEVRFYNPSKIHGHLLTVIRQRLLVSDLTPAADLSGAAASSLKFNDKSQPGASFPDPAPQLLESDGGVKTYKASDQTSGLRNSPSKGFTDFFERAAPQQKGFEYNQVKQAYDYTQPPIQEAERSAGGAGQWSGEGARPEVLLSNQTILQVRNAFVVAQDEKGILIIDQHALHERVMFEQLFKRIIKESQALEAQRLLVPVVINASPSRLDTLDQIQPLLKKIGIEADQMGPQSIGIQAFATFLFDRHVQPQEFLDELIDKVEDGQITFNANSKSNVDTSYEAALHKVIDMMSCKAAIKAGDKLSDQELVSLLEKREMVERSSNCPHGRPTTIRLSWHDLAKQFKRE